MRPHAPALLLSGLLPLSGLLLPGCAPRFATAVTPSGVPCVDMPVIPAGTEPDRPYHRLRPVASALRARTEAERLWSLREAACRAGADAVIEAAQEEVRGPDGAYSAQAGGTAVIWRR